MIKKLVDLKEHSDALPAESTWSGIQDFMQITFLLLSPDLFPMKWGSVGLAKECAWILGYISDLFIAFSYSPVTFTGTLF